MFVPLINTIYLRTHIQMIQHIYDKMFDKMCLVLLINLSCLTPRIKGTFKVKKARRIMVATHIGKLSIYQTYRFC